MCVCAALCKGMDADHDISSGELNDNNNSTACLLYNFSQHEYSVIGPTHIVSDIVGLLSSTVAIVLVLVTRSYLVTIYRIILYMSIAALLNVIGGGVMSIPYALQEPTPSIYNNYDCGFPHWILRTGICTCTVLDRSPCILTGCVQSAFTGN